MYNSLFFSFFNQNMYSEIGLTSISVDRKKAKDRKKEKREKKSIIIIITLSFPFCDCRLTSGRNTIPPPPTPHGRSAHLHDFILNTLKACIITMSGQD